MRKSTSFVSVAGSSYRRTAYFLGNEVQFVTYDLPPARYKLVRSGIMSLPAAFAALMAVIIAKCLPF